MNSKNLRPGELVCCRKGADAALYQIVSEDGFVLAIIPASARVNERVQYTDVSITNRATIPQKLNWLNEEPWFTSCPAENGTDEHYYYFRTQRAAEVFAQIVKGRGPLETTPGAIWRVASRWTKSEKAA